MKYSVYRPKWMRGDPDPIVEGFAGNCNTDPVFLTDDRTIAMTPKDLKSIVDSFAPHIIGPNATDAATNLMRLAEQIERRTRNNACWVVRSFASGFENRLRQIEE